MALEEDEPAPTALAAANGGMLVRDASDPLTYWLVARPRTAADERYFIRIGWVRYPHQPPSVKFADAVGGALNVTSAWPVIAGYRPASFDICKPFTAEGFATHPEWANGQEAWPITGNPFLWVVETLQSDLDTGYGGRSA